MNNFAPTLLISAAYAAAGEYDYMENGRDWTDGVCATGVNQSPIDLSKNHSSTSWAYNLFASPSGFPATNTLSIGLPAPARGKLPKAAIKLDLGADVEGASMLLERPGRNTSLWNPLQLHWHAPAEHTHNGELYIAEMHIVHTPMNGVGADGNNYETATENPDELAVLGIWFEE